MRDHRLRRDAAEILADRDQLVAPVAAERAGAAGLLHAVERADVHRDGAQLGAVQEPGEHVRPVLAGRRIGGQERVLDEDVHGLAVGRRHRAAGEAGRCLGEPRRDRRRVRAGTVCVRPGPGRPGLGRAREDGAPRRADEGEREIGRRRKVSQ